MAEDQPAGAVPQPAPMIRPGTGSQPPADTADPRARAAALRAEAAALEASLEGPGTVNVKVGPPHSQMLFGGFNLSADWPTPVPAARLADLRQAADRAGVQLITEG